MVASIVGDRIVIGGAAGTLRTVEAVLGEHELRLVVQVPPEGRDAFSDRRKRVASSRGIHAA